MYETARLQGRPAPNAAEFNTYAFIMLLVGRQKDAATHFFQVPWKLPLKQLSLKALAHASSTLRSGWTQMSLLCLLFILCLERMLVMQTTLPLVFEPFCTFLDSALCLAYKAC